MRIAERTRIDPASLPVSPLPDGGEPALPSSGRHGQLLLLAVLAVLFTAWSARFIAGTSFVAIDGRLHFALFDDAMVSMRYAWNFVNQAGLVWNPGERVEGYTNLLMTMIMAGAIGVFGHDIAPVAVQAFGVLTVLACAWLAIPISDRLVGLEPATLRRGRQILVAASVLMLYPLVFWSELGMETGLLTLLVLASTGLALKATPAGFARLVAIALLLGLAYLTRPDAAIFAGVLFAFLACEAVRTRRAKAKPLLALVSAGLLLLVFPLAQTIFRLWYYGELVPNTYTLKIDGIPLMVRLSNGWIFLKDFLPSAAPALLMLAVAVLPRLTFRKGLLLVLLASAAMYQVWVGGDAWPRWRMLTPVLPLLSILLVDAGLRIGQLVHDKFRPASVIRLVPLLLGVSSCITTFGLGAIDYPFRREILFLDRPYHAETNELNTNVGLALNALTRPTATTAVFWAGEIPYYAERPAIDMLGKSDNVIARLPPDLSGVLGGYGMSTIPGHNKYDLDYSIKTLDPTYIQYPGWGRQDLREWATTHYEVVVYKGVSLLFRKDSRDVLWDRADQTLPITVRTSS